MLGDAHLFVLVHRSLSQFIKALRLQICQLSALEFFNTERTRISFNLVLRLQGFALNLGLSLHVTNRLQALLFLLRR